MLLQCLARGTTHMPRPQEEVIQAREATITVEDTSATTVHAAEASIQEAVVASESTVTFIKEVESQATLAEKEAWERVSRMGRIVP
jgi:hypothetical protein